MRIGQPTTFTRRWGRQAFTLVEVMVALALFFMCTFAILGLTSQLLQNARVFQTKKSPSLDMVHAWYTSKTNRVTPGESSYEFSDISSDIGDLYRDYNFTITAEENLEMTNGLYDVTYRLFNKRTHKVEEESLTFYWDPNSKAQGRQAGGLRR